ncbi:hypothetical protein [Streptococcus sp. E24BD]|uniref:hypothetical protein n=1 Tax=Streptococcus sp. E24BD TaxID=3278715 RepID=UPI00359E692D
MMHEWRIRLLNLYTSLLMSIFFHWKEPVEGLLWLSALYLLNLIFFYMMMLSKRKEFRIHHLLGRPHHQLLTASFLSQLRWQLLPVLIWEVGLFFILPSDFFRVIGLLLFIIGAILAKHLMLEYILKH